MSQRLATVLLSSWLALLLASCGGSSSEPRFAPMGLGTRCDSAAVTPCTSGNGLTCFVKEGSTCTKACNASSECPGDNFCYIFDQSQGHTCVSFCNTEAECQSVNPSLHCLMRAATEAIGRKICVSN